jgi:hypothetical protein
MLNKFIRKNNALCAAGGGVPISALKKHFSEDDSDKP